MASTTAAVVRPKRVLPRKLVGSFSVYLLTPVQAPHHLQKHYIGFSTNPFHRRRQHNGEIKGGAWRTRRYRPWEIVCVLTGFKDNISALQFEWLWQHPYRSKLSRDVLTHHVKGKRGVGQENCVKRKLIELFWILSTHFKRQQGLAVHFVSESMYARFKDEPLLVQLPSNIKLVTGEAPELLAELYLKHPPPQPSGTYGQDNANNNNLDESADIEILADIFEIEDDDDENEEAAKLSGSDGKREEEGELTDEASPSDEEDDDDSALYADAMQFDDQFELDDNKDVSMIDLVSSSPKPASTCSLHIAMRHGMNMSMETVESQCDMSVLTLDNPREEDIVYLTEDSDGDELMPREGLFESRGSSLKGKEAEEEDSILHFDFRRPSKRREGK